MTEKKKHPWFEESDFPCFLCGKTEWKEGMHLVEMYPHSVKFLVCVACYLKHDCIDKVTAKYLKLQREG